MTELAGKAAYGPEVDQVTDPQEARLTAAARCPFCACPLCHERARCSTCHPRSVPR